VLLIILRGGLVGEIALSGRVFRNPRGRIFQWVPLLIVIVFAIPTVCIIFPTLKITANSVFPAKVATSDSSPKQTKGEIIYAPISAAGEGQVTVDAPYIPPVPGWEVAGEQSGAPLSGKTPPTSEPADGVNDGEMTASKLKATITAAMSSQTAGVIGIEAPDTILIDEPRTIQVTIARPDKSKFDDVKEAFKKQYGDKSDILKTDVMMGVSLHSEDDGIAIEKLFGSDVQPIADNDAATWEFSITGKKPGTHKLQVTAFIRIFLPGNIQQDTKYKTYERGITITASYWYPVTSFIRQNYVASLGAIGLAALGLISAGIKSWFARRAARSDRPAPPPIDGET